MLNDSLREKLPEVARQYEELGEQLGTPEVIADPRKMREIGKARARLEPVVEYFREYQQVEGDIGEAQSLLAEENDAELEHELARLKERLGVLAEHLEEELAPRDPDDDRDSILEIRAGTGGEEAA
jgi:peptide chain release factor 1